MSTRYPVREPVLSAAFLEGVKDALGVPAAVLAAGMIGFGAFALGCVEYKADEKIHRSIGPAHTLC